MLLRELLDDPALGLEVLAPGAPDREVRWVHSIEVADPGAYLRGGEVVLTTGSWERLGRAPAAWVEEVAAAGAIAIGFGRLEAADQPPAELVGAAAARGLTFFVVPVAVPFVQLAEVFIAAKRVEWEAPLRRQLEHHGAIVAALRAERGVDSVLRVLRRRLGLEVAVVAGTTTHGPVPAGGCPVALIGEGLADDSLVLPRPLAELDVDVQAAVSSAMPFLALELERERAVRATEQRYAWEVVEWIATGVSAAAVTARLELLGVPLERTLRCVVARGAGPEEVQAALAPYLIVERSDDVVCLVDADAPRVELAGYVGVGQAVPIAELRVSLLQARHAADALVARGAEGWLTHEELASPAVLLAAQDPAVLHALARTVLGGVLDSDRDRGTELVASLRSFLERGGRWQETADALHVHINTLRHRMKRVEELTGRSLASTADRVDLFLALRALA
ncbi:PucR family transcriptional regulator [Nocardioides albidus]|uniref:PucR family transcriptional regulator n=1 Tax=Nocardioides albidus TaxID=1517589 RepID=A0A5C4W4N5_9ACTN|nr:helix-turn-helix domain-containing protein [Nocardioides albidus]TNM43247.1 PucR family transcriptional regulator [Nocardioides albidus]